MSGIGDYLGVMIKTTTQAGRRSNKASARAQNAQALVSSRIGTMKTTKADVSKATAKTEKASVITWKEGKHGYRLFRAVDSTEYSVRQGEFTIAGIRGLEFAQSETSAKGTDIALFTNGKGICGIRGKLNNDKKSLQAGLFIIRLDNRKDVRLFASESALMAHINKDGMRGTKNSRDIRGNVLIAGIGVGMAYGMAVTSKGKLVRLEDSHSGKDRGGRFSYTW